MCQLSQKPHRLGIERLTKTRGLLIHYYYYYVFVFFFLLFSFFQVFFSVFLIFLFCLFASIIEMAVTGLQQILS